MDDDSDTMQSGDGSVEDDSLDFGASAGDEESSDDQSDNGSDGSASDGGDDSWGGVSDDWGGDGGSEDGGTTDAMAYGTNADRAVELGPVLNTVGDSAHVVVDSALSAIAYGFGGAAGLLGNEQDAANWNDVGNKSLENARISGRNLRRDIGVMDGEREPLPYTDSGERCPVEHN
jgi:hypothetical protein